MIAYHFLREDYTAGEGSEPAWAEGETRTLAGEIIPCQFGYHASPTLFDALKFAPGPVACVVELSGTIVEHGNPLDKFAASTRKLVRAVSIERELRLFAADCVEHVLYIYERDYPNDTRPRLAIKAARDFAEGRIKRADLAAAQDAAQDAARAAALNAAQDAVRDAVRAAAWAAAWAAAQDAVRAAAQDAAWAAAWAAAQDAVRAAAQDAAWAAEIEWQRTTFNARILPLLGVA